MGRACCWIQSIAESAVLSFDEFLAIPPCATGNHSSEAPPPAIETAQKAQATYSDASPPVGQSITSTIPAIPPRTTPIPPKEPTSRSSTPFPVSVEVEQDPENGSPVEGAKCKRQGCGKSYHAGIERADEECIWHPGSAIFHEGSKVQCILNVLSVSLLRKHCHNRAGLVVKSEFWIFPTFWASKI